MYLRPILGTHSAGAHIDRRENAASMASSGVLNVRSAASTFRATGTGIGRDSACCTRSISTAPVADPISKCCRSAASDAFCLGGSATFTGRHGHSYKDHEHHRITFALARAFCVAAPLTASAEERHRYDSVNHHRSIDPVCTSWLLCCSGTALLEC